MTAPNRRGWVGIDRNWLTDKRLSDAGLRLMCWLDSHSDSYLRDLHVKRIATEIGWSRGKVARHLDALAELGLVETRQIDDHASGSRTLIAIDQGAWSDRTCVPERNTPVLHDGTQAVLHDGTPTTSTWTGQESTPSNSLIVPDEQTSVPVAADIDAFDEWWSIYPRKVEKKRARTAWRNLSKRDRQAALDALPAHVIMWETEGRGTRTTPHPTTWLNGERWNDVLDHRPEQPILNGRAAVIQNNNRLLAHEVPDGNPDGPLQIDPVPDYGRVIDI